MNRIPAIAHELHSRLTWPRRAEYLLSIGFGVIGSGMWKDVFGSPSHPFVVKLGGGGGMNEVKNAENAPAHLKPFLLPILAWGYGFQIQERIELRPCPPTCGGAVDGMYDSDGEARNHTHDANGRLVIIDYGQDDQWEVSEDE